jgi:hypothetical protein
MPLALVSRVQICHQVRMMHPDNNCGPMNIVSAT